MRAFAIAGVVLFHLFGISGVLTAGGDSLHERLIWTVFGNTLDFFFIISGFVLFLPVLRRNGEIGPLFDWYVKRFGRLQPEYWACLVVIVLMIAFVPKDFGAPVPGVGAFLLHFFDLQTGYHLLDPQFRVGFFIGGGPVWLVSVIAGLYLLFPLLAWLMRRGVVMTLILAAAVTVAWKLGPVHVPGIFQALSGHEVSDDAVRVIAADQTPAYLYSFALGMAVALLYMWTRRNPGSPWIHRGKILAFAIGIPLYLLISIPYTDAAMTTADGIDGSTRGRNLAFNGLASTTVRAMLLLGLILGPAWLQRPFASRRVGWFADQSFGVYLIHLPLAFLVLVYVTPPQTGSLKALLVWLALVLPAATLYAWFSRRFIGVPASRAVDGWLRRRRGLPERS